MQKLASYQNGNSFVTIFDDGTLIREFPDGETPKPVHPSSIDVKITDYCTAGCSYCHEKSTKAGLHSDLEKLKIVLAELPVGVELAIGGGNPLDHPDLLPFLYWAAERGLIINMTINQKHLRPQQELIMRIINEDLVKGVGISYSSSTFLPYVLPILQATNNVVFHVIMGINKVNVIDELSEFCNKNNKPCKILVLGYKNYGFGINYYVKNKSVEDVKYQWFIKLGKYFSQKDLTLSFDNLAIEQLKLKRFFKQSSWDKFFMGTDGSWTCYIDAVKQEYAMSSTTVKRVSFDNQSLNSFFQSLHS